MFGTPVRSRVLFAVDKGHRLTLHHAVGNYYLHYSQVRRFLALAERETLPKNLAK